MKGWQFSRHGIFHNDSCQLSPFKHVLWSSCLHDFSQFFKTFEGRSTVPLHSPARHSLFEITEALGSQSIPSHSDDRSVFWRNNSGASSWAKSPTYPDGAVGTSSNSMGEWGMFNCHIWYIWYIWWQGFRVYLQWYIMIYHCFTVENTQRHFSMDFVWKLDDNVLVLMLDLHCRCTMLER